MLVCQYVSMSICQNETFQLRFQDVKQSDSAILLYVQDTGTVLYGQDTGILLQDTGTLLYGQDTGILLYCIRTAKELALVFLYFRIYWP